MTSRGGSATFKVVRPGSRCGWVWLKRGIVTISKFTIDNKTTLYVVKLIESATISDHCKQIT